MTAPGIPNDFALSTSCFGTRLDTIEDQVFAAVAMGFRQIELGLSETPAKLTGYADAQRETGCRITSLVAGCLKPSGEKMTCLGLSSLDEDEREQAVNAVKLHIQLAQRLAVPIVTIRGTKVADAKLQQDARDLNNELARDGLSDTLRDKMRAFVHRVQKKGSRQIENLCRSLHTLMAQFPETKLALEPGIYIDDLLSFEVMGWVLDDLEKYKLGYWHDVGRIQQRQRHGLPTQGQWLEAYAPRMLGVHLQDSADEEAEMPPGLGEVDWKLIASYLPRNAVRVLEVNQRHGRTELLGSVQFLVDRGI
ncbi:MAG: TIM barrel protein [Planctomycetes bacterium]|nr:TIM barrel protein [Planctomycetota bacterium]